MNPGRIDIQGKLPRGAIEMYLQIDACAQQEDIRFLVVGAFARELILVHGFDAKYARATKDLDFGIQLKTWEAFHQLKSRLKDFGFQSHPTINHRMLFTDSDNTEWIMDLLPFGDLTENDQELLWPPEGDVRMSTHGFSEAMESAWQVRINDQPVCDLDVANPVAVIALKLVAWTERDRGVRKKDIQDIEYIIKNYAKVPIIDDALYERGFMEECDYDQELATAAYLGKELDTLILPNTREYLSTHLTNNQQAVEEMQREMESKISIQWFKLVLKNL